MAKLAQARRRSIPQKSDFHKLGGVTMLFTYPSKDCRPVIKGLETRILYVNGSLIEGIHFKLAQKMCDGLFECFNQM